jgi:dipeptidyl aminopeptidase/acylaminoacyl peptidase
MANTLPHPKPRLVLLPHESHGYRARESVLHMLWEMDQWLEKYVKNAKEGK